MRLVTLNGPIGVGKSWTADRIHEHIIRYRGNQTAVERVSFQDPLRKATMEMLCATHMNYDQFKTHMFEGKTGREWMIYFATAARKADPVFYSRRLKEQMEHIYSKTRIQRSVLFIADSNGFEDELDFMRAQVNIDLLACSIEPVDSVPRGEQYPRDSRFNLAHKCSVVATDSNGMKEALIKALTRRGWI